MMCKEDIFTDLDSIERWISLIVDENEILEKKVSYLRGENTTLREDIRYTKRENVQLKKQIKIFEIVLDQNDINTEWDLLCGSEVCYFDGDYDCQYCEYLEVPE